MRSNTILAAIAVVFLVAGCRSKPTPSAAGRGPNNPSMASTQPTTSAAGDQQIEALIDRLAGTDQEGVGYSPNLAGSSFLPADEGDQIGVVLLGQKPAVASQVMLELVRRGVTSVPHLLRHMEDKRPTKLSVSHEGFMGGMEWLDEYDYNARTTRRPPEGVNRQDGFRDSGKYRGHQPDVTSLWSAGAALFPGP